MTREQIEAGLALLLKTSKDKPDFMVCSADYLRNALEKLGRDSSWVEDGKAYCIHNGIIEEFDGKGI